MRRAFFAILFALLATAWLAGCGGGPPAEGIRTGLNERLAQALPPGTVELVGIDRRGSQSDTKAPAGETRRVVYFDAELKLLRDYDFGAWDSPGVAGLVSALGSGPRGITGITSGGNKAGDIIRAHGTALYKREGERWVSVLPAGYRPAEAPAVATNAPSGPAAILDAMRKVIESVQKDASPAQRAIIEQELTTAHANIRARLARANEGYAIAAGAEHGQYLRFAQALVDGVKVRAIPLVTRGGEENLRLLRAGKVSVALAQADAALEAYEGKGVFAGDGPHASLRAVGSLYPEPVHVLVRGADPARSVSDLRGKRIAVGERGSASRVTVLRVLAAHGLTDKDFKAEEVGLGPALVALRQNQVDAVMQVIGVPSDSIREAIGEMPLRLLPLDERAIAAMVAQKAGYFRATIAPGTYPGLHEPVRSLATAAILVTGPDLSDTEVAELTRLVYAHGRDFVARGSAQGGQISVATSREGLVIPQHLAAAKVLDGMARGGAAAPATPPAPPPASGARAR
ncbi:MULTISPECIES: TAXI family TRAP transporter solute-binding subunit [Cupriavidus]|uniref:TAXI family TRAP transporter solute-binding subunit n=1 Tax=Cupriavidus sp. DF5525 TaxID=3160989 RepID=UPI0003B0E8D1|nr:glutamate permease [Ralstonia pickettii DTP0602]